MNTKQHYRVSTGQNVLRVIGAWMTAMLAACTTPTATPTAAPISLTSTPTITVKPSTVGPGTPLTIDGAGFLSAARVLVHVRSPDGQNSTPLAEVVPNAGSFKLIVIMPTLAINGDLLIIASSADQSANAIASITYSPEMVNTAQPAALAGGQAPALTATASPAPTEPTVVIEPNTGSAGTEVRVMGSGFPVNTPAIVKLGVPGAGAAERVYARGVTDAQGKIQLVFTAPAAWPDGRSISESRLIVLLSTEDEAARALAELNYRPLPQPTDTPALPTPTAVIDFGSVNTPNAVQAAIDFFYAVIRDPNGTSAAAYFSTNLQAEVRAGRSVLSILNLPALFVRFEVNTLSASAETVVMQANLTYADGSMVQRILNMVKDGENWRIDSVQ